MKKVRENEINFKNKKIFCEKNAGKGKNFR